MFATKSKVEFVLKYENIPKMFSRIIPLVFPSPKTCFQPLSVVVRLVRNIKEHWIGLEKLLSTSYIFVVPPSSVALQSISFALAPVSLISYLTFNLRKSKTFVAALNLTHSSRQALSYTILIKIQNTLVLSAYVISGSITSRSNFFVNSLPCINSLFSYVDV